MVSEEVGTIVFGLKALLFLQVLVLSALLFSGKGLRVCLVVISDENRSTE